MKTYLFYDLETSGLNKAFDQVMQFAAIRTDQEFHEIERYNFYVKLNPDVFPSPGAIVTHRISIHTANKEGLCEYEAIKKIHELFNEPGTLSLGYNTLGFDDEFLRFSFYRNLFLPYTHQWANGCSRADLYPIVAMYFLYKNDCLKWPRIDGKVRLKLEYLSEMNHLAEGQAHDAMVDVDATVSLARRLSKEKAMWDYLISGFLKPIDLERMVSLEEALMIDGKFGSDAFFQSHVLFLGRHHHYKNQTFWLRLDKADFIQSVDRVYDASTEEDMDENHFDSPLNFYTLKRKDGEPQFLLPLEKRFLKHMTQERLNLIRSNKQWVDLHQEDVEEFKNKLLSYRYPDIPNLDVDAALYQNGFLNDYQQSLCRRFHTLSPEAKSEFIDQFDWPQLKEQAIRIIARNYPQYLSQKHEQSYLSYLKLLNPKNEEKVLTDHRYQKRQTRSQVLMEISQLKQNGRLDEEQQQLLSELQEMSS